jgi:pimeloyl-ACP methyl ester carboxylesterase
MSTADVARDLDILRQAVGDEKLNFVGYSYGTHLGITYANLFPDNVGAMIIDSVVDPVAWSTGHDWLSSFFPVTSRINSAEGASDTLKEFFRLCDEAGIEACALAGNSESRFATIANSLKELPYYFIDESGNEGIIDYSILVSITLSSLYNPFSWQEGALLLASLEGDLSQREVGERYLKLRQTLGLNDEPNSLAVEQPFDLGFHGVACSDTDNPHHFVNWPWAARVMDASHKYFGSAWTWGSSACYSWPGSKKSRYSGGYEVVTENPILIVSNLYDPATPYQNAVVANKLLKNSRLLTVNGWGHAGILLSGCANNYAADYLLSGHLPEEGATCESDAIPFPPPTPNATPYSARGMQSRSDGSERSDSEKEAVQKALLKEILPSNF